jgi:hypothetical protein
MQTEKPAILAQKANQKPPKKTVFSYQILFVLVGILATITAILFFYASDVRQDEKLRLEVLKNKCYRGEKFSAEEAEEFCMLLSKVEKVYQNDCQKVVNDYFQQHLDSLIFDSKFCIEKLAQKIEQNGFHTTTEVVLNKRGYFVNAYKNKSLIFTFRIMHRSSGGKAYRNDFDYMALHDLEGSSYVDINAKKTNSIADRHIPYEGCESAEALVSNFLTNYAQKQK